MYSVIVTMLMSFGTTTPEFGWFRGSGCGGCNGCYGSGFASCYGCNGCTGGGGRLGQGLFSRYRHGSCHGCSGCYGGCVGSYSLPVTEGIGIGYPSPAIGIGYPSPAISMPAPMPLMPGGPILPPAGLGATTLPPAVLGETTAPPAAINESTAGPNQVTLVVTLPADARLYAEKQLIPLAGPVRVFVTPPLEPGRTYFYELAMEVERGNQTLRNAQNVELQVGKVSRVTFPDPAGEMPPAKDTARITVRVPAGATLYVEGRPWDFGNDQRVIRTPPLEPGRTHYYTLQVAVERDGRRDTRTREVAFRAGQDVTVDFVEPTTTGVAKR